MTQWLLAFHTVLLGPSLHDRSGGNWFRCRPNFNINLSPQSLEGRHRSRFDIIAKQSQANQHTEAIFGLTWGMELGHIHEMCTADKSAEWKLNDRGKWEGKLHCLTISNCLMPNLIVLLLCVLLVLWLGLLCNINEWGCCCCCWWEVLESVSPIKLQ